MLGWVGLEFIPKFLSLCFRMKMTTRMTKKVAVLMMLVTLKTRMRMMKMRVGRVRMRMRTSRTWMI